MQPIPEYLDVVLGYDAQSDVFVGLEPDRLRHGGRTSNASTFLEPRGLQRNEDAPFLILLRRTRLYPEGEYQAFFRPQKIDEYLLNHTAIHSGSYPVTGRRTAPAVSQRSGNNFIGELRAEEAVGRELWLSKGLDRLPRIGRLTIRALNLAQSSTTELDHIEITPEELAAIQQRKDENGFLGEQFVLEVERRSLREAGREDLARRIEWVSRFSVCAGYDIASFDPDTGGRRYIEVKASERAGRWFDVSHNEWAMAQELGTKYYIYRVSMVRETPNIDYRLRDPARLARDGQLQLSPSGWRVGVVPPQ